MTQVVISHPAPDGVCFTPGAFDDQVGKRLPVSVEGVPSDTMARVVAVKVPPGGGSVVLTLDIDDSQFGDRTVLWTLGATWIRE